MPERRAELTTWAVIYLSFGCLSLAAAVFGGAGEAPYYLAASLTLLPLGIGFWFRWSWARWTGFLVFGGIAAWSVWQLAHLRLWFLSIALLLTSAETMSCLRAWPSRRRSPPSGDPPASEYPT